MAVKIDFDMLREFLKDKPQLNFLNDNLEQFPEDTMETLIPLVLDDIKIFAPALAPYIDRIPPGLIMYGLVAKLLQSEMFLQLRNKIAVGDNNNSGTSIFGKEQEYAQLANMFENQFQRGLNQLAKSVYYNSMWGSVASNSADIEYFGDISMSPLIWRLL